MENGEQNVNRWVDERMASLDAPEWRPDPDLGLARLRRKDRIVRRRRWGMSLAFVIALTSSLFVIPGCQAATCKVPSDNLAERLWKTVFRNQDAVPPNVTPAPAAAPPVPSASESVKPPTRRPRNFKESGIPSAPLTCEFYTDYECAACAFFYGQVLPQLRVEYVETGKMKLLHRDYPLAMHQHSRLAARYANAAGLAGHYETAVAQIFRTQSSWGLTGDIDGQLALVLPPEVMARVRRTVEGDPRLDDSVLADMEHARADQLHQTPTVVLVSGGRREVIAYRGDYAMLKMAIDQALGAMR